MTKVKQIKSGKKAGKAPAQPDAATSAAEKTLSDGKLITAQRNGVTRSFTKLTWDLLPPDKEGWKPSSEKPAELPTSGTQTVTDSKDEKAFSALRAAYKAVHGTDAPETLTIDELGKAISSKIDEGEEDPDEDQDTETDVQLQEARKAYKAIFEKDADEALTLEQLNEAIQSDLDETEDDHVLTQEDLDLNPELAEQGLKVGEAVKTSKVKGGNE